MPYRPSLQKIVRVKTFLDEMVRASQSTRWNDTTENNRLAYWIREGIAAAGMMTNLGEPYITYAKLKEKFVIKERGLVVHAELRITSLPPIDHTILNEVTIPGVVSALEIIGAAITHRKDKMIFPDALAHPTELRAWCDKHGYTVTNEDTGLTLCRAQNGQLFSEQMT